MADDAGEKSEEPTSRQFEKAREEGNVAKSKELTSGVMLVLTALFLYFYFPYIMDISQEMFIEFFQFGRISLTDESIKPITFLALQFMGKLMLPMFLFLFVGALMIEAAQVGFKISTKALEPKWDRVNFFVGLPKFFQGKRKLVELIKSLLKIILLGAISINIINNHMDEIMRMVDSEYMDSSVFTAKLLFELVFKISIVVLVLGVMDLAYQKWQQKKDLMMTKQQVKEEYKQMEGDPLIKQRIRSAQRELARKRMMEDVPKSDVVVTNPIHYAVALKYDTEGGGAPIVVAKGQRLMAIKIKDLARESGVYIHEDPPLAQNLYKTLDIGDQIPENLYKAVAEILAVVYQMKKK
ncbi:MAG: flagellar biosynthesis protein FlhB [Deferribacteraceae bacterium]|jgi:flagellar biosynthetic protein FlhB|nr:flagellar biosynthesis protein FlhB [Deferribacteraceae bacterium]